MTRHFCRKKFKECSLRHWQRCKWKFLHQVVQTEKMCHVRPDLHSPLWVSLWNVTMIATSSVVRLYLLSFIVSPHPCPSHLRPPFSPHCSCPVPPLHTLMPPVDPSPRSLCLHTNWLFTSSILGVAVHSGRSLGPDGWPVVVIWTG